jgi:GAF domain-containing protein
LSQVQADSDAADLQRSLHELATLVSGSLGLPDVLSHVATFAVRAIPGAEGAGVTLLSTDERTTVQGLAASDPFVAEIDEIQYTILNEGPCITAALERRTVRSGSLGGEKMWPRFGPRVGRLGVHSALSLPLIVADRAVGAINVYSRSKDAFDDHAAELGELFATPAAVAVQNAQILAQAQALATQLQAALSSRPIIDQAIGILRGRSGGTAEEAFARLRTMSQSDHVKLVDVAQHIVDEAVRRARARHAQD